MLAVAVGVGGGVAGLRAERLRRAPLPLMVAGLAEPGFRLVGEESSGLRPVHCRPFQPLSSRVLGEVKSLAELGALNELQFE
jgi:hypothetical protein